MSNQHSLLVTYHPDANGQVQIPWLPLFMNHGPNSFPLVFDRFGYPVGHLMISFQPLFPQANNNISGMVQLFQPNNFNPVPSPVLRNGRLMDLMSPFDHGYGGRQNNNGQQVLNLMGRLNSTGGGVTRNRVAMQELNFKCVECGKSFPTGRALGGHASYHSKMRNLASKMKSAQEAADTDHSAGPSVTRDRPSDLENEVEPFVPPFKIRKFI